MCCGGGAINLTGAWRRWRRKCKRHQRPASPSPSNQSWSIWKRDATSLPFSLARWPTSSQEGGQQAGVNRREEAASTVSASAVAAAAYYLKKLCPWWRPQGDPHEFGCAMTRTCPPFPFGMGRTRGPSSRGWSSPPCTAMFFARTCTCAGCAVRTVSVKTCTPPPPLRRQPPSPSYLKWLGGMTGVPAA